MYVLKERDSGKYYIGYTSDLRKRINEHKNKLVQSTKYGHYSLVYYEAYVGRSYAMKRERVLKHHGSVKNYLIKRIEESLE